MLKGDINYKTNDNYEKTNEITKSDIELFYMSYEQMSS